MIDRNGWTRDGRQEKERKVAAHDISESGKSSSIMHHGGGERKE